MRRRLTAGVLTVILACTARSAAAQTKAWPEKGWFSVSGGVQPTVNSFSDAFDLPLYAEIEHVTVSSPVKGGTLVAASGGYRVWKQLAIGLDVTRYNRGASARVTAQIPHPFFDNQFRQVQGTTSATRNEVGVHVLIGWMMPLTDRLRLLVTAGPSAISVGQTLVTGAQFSETYPYDTATFTGADTKNATVTAMGFNAGADVFWMFSRNIGAGGLIRFTRARAKVSTGAGRTISIDAGGAQAGAGLRVVF